MHILLAWTVESYTVTLIYAAVTAFAWHHDVRIGMALGICLPIAFALGRGSVSDHR